jgi:hypothetical protein
VKWMFVARSAVAKVQSPQVDHHVLLGLGLCPAWDDCRGGGRLPNESHNQHGESSASTKTGRV